MTTTSGLSARQGLLPIRVPNFDRDFVKLQRNVAGAGGGKRSALVPMFTDPEDLEGMFTMMIDFDDAVDDRRLRLNDGPLKYRFFRQCLMDQPRIDWDNAATAAAAAVPAGAGAAIGETDDSFTDARNRLVATYLLPTDLQDQMYWLGRQEMSMYPEISVQNWTSRIKRLNMMYSYFPGVGGNQPYDDNAMKQLLYQQMHPRWKTKFMENDNDINDAGYTIDRLIRFMRTQETIKQNRSAERREAQERKEAKSKGNEGKGRGKNSGSRDSSSSNVGKYYRRGQGPPGGRGNDKFNGKSYETVKRGDFTCPWHGKHKWNSCFGNPDSSKFRPTFGLKEKGDAHAIEGVSKRVRKRLGNESEQSNKRRKGTDGEVHFADKIRVLGYDSDDSDSESE